MPHNAEVMTQSVGIFNRACQIPILCAQSWCLQRDAIIAATREHKIIDTQDQWLTPD